MLKKPIKKIDSVGMSERCLSNLKLHRLQETREVNIATMTAWPWTKTAKHLDLIDQQLVWANEQRNETAVARLEECRCQIVTARCRKLDAEQ